MTDNLERDTYMQARIIRDFLLRHRWLWAALLLATAWKAVLLCAGSFPFNADESVVALMARHILQGEWPLFFYGQAYMGSLDAYLTAVGFRIAGESPFVLRAVQSILYAASIACWYAFLLRAFRSLRLAGWTALLMAIPSVLVTLYTTVSLGGYGEALLLGSICLLLGTFIPAAPGRGWIWGALGLAAGLGFWAFPLSAMFAIPAVAGALWAQIRRQPTQTRGGSSIAIPLVTLIAGGLAGASPWLAGWLQFGNTALAELGGSAIADTLSGNPAGVAWLRLINLVIFGGTVTLGLRPPWAFEFPIFWMQPFAGAAGVAGLVFGIRTALRPEGSPWPRRILAAACLLFAAGFLITPFGNDPSGRYFLLLCPVLYTALAGLSDAYTARWPRLSAAPFLILLCFHLLSTVELARRNPPGITTQFDPVAQVDQRDLPTVMDFLRAQGETRGYTNYWVSFPLAFLSQEDLIFTARLPYHEDLRYTLRDDRYPPYDDVVAASPRTAYITTRNPNLDRFLADAFRSLGVTYQLKEIGDFRIFYHLSRAVRPEEMGAAFAAPAPASEPTAY